MRMILALIVCLLVTPALADGIALSGSLQHPGNVTMAQLRAMPQIDVKVDQLTDKGRFTGDFHGVLLWTLIDNAGLIDGPQRHAILLHGIVVTASGDDYATLISLGEIHPKLGNGQVILATQENGQPLAQPVLIVPGDGHAARNVRGVTAVDVTLGTPPSVGRAPKDHLN